MKWKIHREQPLSAIYDSSRPALYAPTGQATFPSMNVNIRQKSIKKRYGYETTVTGKSDMEIQLVANFQQVDGTVKCVFLDQEDVMVKETASGKTYSYRTPNYTTGTITSITSTTVEGNGTDWATAAIAAGDYFIMDDDHTSDEENDANWVKVASVTDLNTLVLASAYTKNGTAYKLRQIYSVPTNERWCYAVVHDKFVFSNGNENVQYWDGTTSKATALDSTNAVKARCMIPYANRLLLADHYISGTREPYTLSWSANGDPTKWASEDVTAGAVDFLETSGTLKGLGIVGAKLLVYREDSFVLGSRTGIDEAPIYFPTEKRGVGLLAPYSLAHFEGTNVFRGKDDFYMIVGENAEPIGGPIREIFDDQVDEEMARDIFVLWDSYRNRVLWFSQTLDYGQVAWVWDYKEDSWTTFKFAHVITGGGVGAI